MSNVTKLSVAQQTRDIAIAALTKIDDHIVECTRMTDAQNSALDAVHSDVKWILRGVITVLVAVCAFFIKATLFTHV